MKRYLHSHKLILAAARIVMVLGLVLLFVVPILLHHVGAAQDRAYDRKMTAQWSPVEATVTSAFPAQGESASTAFQQVTLQVGSGGSAQSVDRLLLFQENGHKVGDTLPAAVNASGDVWVKGVDPQPYPGQGNSWGLTFVGVVMGVIIAFGASVLSTYMRDRVRFPRLQAVRTMTA